MFLINWPLSVLVQILDMPDSIDEFSLGWSLSGGPLVAIPPAEWKMTWMLLISRIKYNILALIL